MADPGARPELAWLPVDKLSVDHRYQRTLESRNSQALIAAITADFRWAMFQAVLVTRCGPDQYLIIDGQHRVEGARGTGIREVPCVIVDAASVGEQAAAFVGANQRRVAVNPYALYHARLAAGEEDAHAIAAVCRAAQITIPRYPIPAAQIKAGETLALGIIARLVKSIGTKVATLSVKAVADAVRDEPGGLRANFFAASAKIVGAAHPDHQTVTAGRVTDAFKKSGWGQTENLAYSRKAKYGGTLVSSLEAILRTRMPASISARDSGGIAPIDRARLMAGR